MDLSLHVSLTFDAVVVQNFAKNYSRIEKTSLAQHEKNVVAGEKSKVCAQIYFIGCAERVASVIFRRSYIYYSIRIISKVKATALMKHFIYFFQGVSINAGGSVCAPAKACRNALGTVLLYYRS